MADVFAHLAAGTIAGMTGVLVDYPLDTLKTRMQACCASSRGSYLQCATSLYERGGLAAFYRGLSVPCAAQGAEAAIIFSVYNTALRHFRAGEIAAAGGASSLPLSPPSIWSSSSYWKASACAGLAVSLVLTPVELLKCNMQVESGRPRWQRRHTTVRSLACELYASNGICSMYRGMTGTMTRAVLGNVAYFMSYEQCKLWLTCVPSASATTGKRDPVPAWRSMLAGGISGCLYWSIAYPADVVKTKMQVCSEASAAGFTATFRGCYRNGGARALYRGWGVTAVRAFVSSAVVFTTYERCFQAMRDVGDVHISVGRDAVAECCACDAKASLL